MSAIQQLLTDHIDIWTAAETEKKSGRGRAASNAASVYGIKKLRELILELAVRGKLVPQDANDEPASELLKQVRAEKMKLVVNGKIKQDKPSALMVEERSLFDLPHSWELERLFEITTGMDSGWSPACLDNNSPSDDVWGILKTTSVQVMNYLAFENKELPANLKPRPEAEVKVGDILFTRAGPMNRVGISCLVHETRPKLMISDKIIRFHPVEAGIYGRFLSLCLNAGETAKFLEKSKSGMAASQVNISQEKLRATPVPIPPLAEQQRIVAKVDELMALCDQLEARHSNAADAHEQLVSHLLGTLTQSQSAADFNTNWQRIAAHFDTLFTTEASIDALEQTLLELAVMGKLVAQDANDEPASEMLKRHKISSEINALPGWSSVPLGKLGVIFSGATPSKAKSEYWVGNIPWISPKDMKRLYIGSAEDSVSEDAIHETSLKLIPPGSILVVVRGMILAHSFPVALTTEKVTINQDMKALVIPGEIKDYLLLYLRAMKNYFVSIVDRSSHGTCKLLSEKLWSTTVTIPPLSEQLRIVAKVDELVALCANLRSRIANASHHQKKLADVLVEHVVMG